MKKKLLFIFPRNIFPIIGGDQIRAYQQLILLTEYFDVYLVYLHSEKEDDNKVLEFIPGLKGSKCFVHSRFDICCGLFRTAINFKPIQVNYYYNSELRNYIKNHSDDFDCLFAGNPRVTDYIVDLPKPRYVDYVDAACMNCKNAIHTAKGLKKLYYFIDSILMKRHERDIARRFDYKAIISPIDKCFIGNDSIDIVGNFVDIPDNSELNNGGLDNVISFIGKMDYEPNVLAVQFFSKEIFPILKYKYPDLQFIIVGAKPDKRVLALSSIDGIKVTGYVDKISPYLQQSSLIVAPMLSGSGVQNKIIQAMSYACCVLTSLIGAEGIDNKKNGLTVCKKNEDWIAEIVNLLHNKEERKKRGMMAHNFIKQTLSKDAIRKQFEKFIKI